MTAGIRVRKGPVFQEALDDLADIAIGRRPDPGPPTAVPAHLLEQPKDSTNLTLRRSRDIDADIEQASTRLISLQTTLQASLQAASRILNTSLTDYLR